MTTMFATRSFVVLSIVAALVACKGNSDKTEPPTLRSAAVVPTTTPTTTTTPTPSTPSDPNKPAKVTDKKKGDQQDDEWVPAEFKSGAARWKDTGVYLDGKCIGFLSWAELPIGLKPTWMKDKISANKRPGSKDLGWRWGQQRYYRFTDYLTAMGIDIKTVKELHVYGPKLSNSVVATTKDLLSPAAKDFLFRFGSNVAGKAIPHVPEAFGHGNPPDKLASLMIYVEKEPPQLKEDGFYLKDVYQQGVPYHGEPLRGGVRVYLDNRLAAIIKRQELDPKKATKAANGELQWSFAEFLTGQGVDFKNVAELYVIRDEMRAEKLAGSDIQSMTFQASAQAKGGVYLTDKLLRTNAIALHTKPVAPEDMPFVTTDDD